jgi:hypothetical protein
VLGTVEDWNGETVNPVLQFVMRNRIANALDALELPAQSVWELGVRGNSIDCGLRQIGEESPTARALLERMAGADLVLGAKDVMLGHDLVEHHRVVAVGDMEDHSLADALAQLGENLACGCA